MIPHCMPDWISWSSRTSFPCSTAAVASSVPGVSSTPSTHCPNFAWRAFRLILEFDGDTKYFDQAQTTEQALLEERERENALIEEGWRIIRVKWKHLNSPELLKARIMKAYLAAQQAAP